MPAYQIPLASASRPLTFLLVASSDSKTGLTGASPAVTISKNGAAFAAPAGAISEVGSGIYKVAGNAADSGTLGPLWLHATAAAADPTDILYEVVAFDGQDGAALGLTRIDAAITSRSTFAGGAVASVTGNVGGSVASVTGAVGSVTGAVGSVTEPVAITLTQAYTPGSYAAATVGDALDQSIKLTGAQLAALVGAIPIEAGVDLRRALALIGAAAAGKRAGFETIGGTKTFLALDGFTPRIATTVDPASNTLTLVYTYAPPA